MSDTEVSDALRIRFPRIEEEDIVALIRYGVAKAERRTLKGPQKRAELIAIVMLLLRELGTPGVKEAVETLGGEAFVGALIDSFCHVASKGLGTSTGI